MKKLNFKNGFIYLTAVLILSSCGSLSISQKRYSNGLNISWFSAKDSKQEVKKEPKKKNEVYLAENSKEEIKVEKVEEAPQVKTEIPEMNLPIKVSETIHQEESANLSQQKALSKKELRQEKRIEKLANKLEKSRIPIIKNVVDETQSSGALKGIGWVFIIIGILFILVISILLGVIFMLLGLVFVLAGS